MNEGKGRDIQGVWVAVGQINKTKRREIDMRYHQSFLLYFLFFVFFISFSSYKCQLSGYSEEILLENAKSLSASSFLFFCNTTISTWQIKWRKKMT